MMNEVYVKFITNIIESGVHDKGFLETYIQMCLVNDRITQEQSIQLLEKLYPPTIEDVPVVIPEYEA